MDREDEDTMFFLGVTLLGLIFFLLFGGWKFLSWLGSFLFDLFLISPLLGAIVTIILFVSFGVIVNVIFGGIVGVVDYSGVAVHKTAETAHEKTKNFVKSLRPHKALIAIADDLNNSELSYVPSYSSKDSNTNIQVHDASIEWIDIECKNNKKLYDTKGNIIVIGNPSSKIHTMATYDINGNILTDSSVKVRAEAKKVIFMDPNDKKDEKLKLKKLYQEGYISKSRYYTLMEDLNK